MRQPSWSGWASIRSNLPRWAGVPLLVAVVIMASLRLGRACPRDVSRGRYCHISERTLLVGTRRRD